MTRSERGDRTIVGSAISRTGVDAANENWPDASRPQRSQELSSLVSSIRGDVIETNRAPNLFNWSIARQPRECFRSIRTVKGVSHPLRPNTDRNPSSNRLSRREQLKVGQSQTRKICRRPGRNTNLRDMFLRQLARQPKHVLAANPGRIR